MSGVGTMSSTSAERAKVIEQIALTLQTSGLRKVAIGSVEADAGTLALACDLAEVSARSGLRTLVLDLTGDLGGPTWEPGVDTASPEPDLNGRRFDRLTASMSADGRAAFNNPARVSAELDRQFENYGLIVLHIAGLVQDGRGRINSVAAGAAADGIVLLCPTGGVRLATARSVMSDLTAAGGKVIGTVLDDRSNPNLGDDIARAAEHVLPFLPGIAATIAGWARRSPFLRTPIHT